MFLSPVGTLTNTSLAHDQPSPSTSVPPPPISLRTTSETSMLSSLCLSHPRQQELCCQCCLVCVVAVHISRRCDDSVVWFVSQPSLATRIVITVLTSKTQCCLVCVVAVHISRRCDDGVVWFVSQPSLETRSVMTVLSGLCLSHPRCHEFALPFP